MHIHNNTLLYRWSACGSSPAAIPRIRATSCSSALSLRLDQEPAAGRPLR